MALFTKLFKRFLDPYQVIGRWYKFVINNGSFVSKDIPEAIVYSSGTGNINVALPPKYKIFDYTVYQSNDFTGSGNQTHNYGVRFIASPAEYAGWTGVMIGGPNHSSYQEVYILIGE